MADPNSRHMGGRPSASFSGNSVIIASFMIFVASIGVYTAFGVFFKPMLNDFGWTKAMTSGAFSLSWVMHGLLGIVMGRLNDRFGPRGVITFSGALMGSGYFFMAHISALWHLYLFYGLMIGPGMSGIWVPAMSTIARLFGEKRGIITAIVMVGGGIGSFAAPPLANWLISQFDWRTSYIIVGSLVFLVVVLSAQFLRSIPFRSGEIRHGHPEKGEDKPDVGGKPFSLKQAVSTRQFWLCSGMIFWFGFCAYVIMVHIVPHATEMGISPARAAIVLAIIGGLSTLGRVVFGGIAHRIGNRQVFIIGFILISVASFWLLAARREWELCLFAAVFGFGFGAGVSNSPLIAELFGLSSHGLILGANIFGYSIGAAAGPLVAGYLFDITGSYQMAFLVCAVAGMSGLLLTALIRAPVQNDGGNSPGQR